MNADTPTIRPATRDDVDAVVRLGMGHAAEMHFGVPSLKRVTEMAGHAFERGRILLSLDDDGQPVGMIALVIEQPGWSEDWQVSDLSFFVEPQHRHRRHARALLQAAKSFAGTLRLPLVVAVWGKRIEGKARLMRRDLGDPSGAIFYIPAPEG
jgi:GNAT superfamily N-acetyltransferase